MIKKALLGTWMMSLVIAHAMSSIAVAEPAYRVSDPISHNNLSIYFIHGRGQAGPPPLTLSEALTKGTVAVYETGKVTELAIENKGTKPVFIQAGDVVRGGKQDRVLTVSLILPAKSGRVPIASYCVEEGRWQKRGKESIRQFTSSANAIPSKRAKLAMQLAHSTQMGRPDAAAIQRSQSISANRLRPLYQQRIDRSATANPRVSESGFNPQSVVWESVASTQRALSQSLKARVAAPESRSSLVLALDNTHLKQAMRRYMDKLLPAAEAHDDILGYVFAINGRVNSADVYPSHSLFEKMWPKLLRASVTEAISEKFPDQKYFSQPTPDDVLSFLKSADAGKRTARAVNNGAQVYTHTSKASYLFTTKLKSGAWIHRNYIAR